MQWSDHGIVLSARRHGESAYVVRLMTHEHGMHAGIIRGGKSALSSLQPGTLVHASWSARLEEHLGNYQLEVADLISAHLLDDALRLAALSSACATVERSLAERDPHADIFEMLLALLNTLKDGEGSEGRSWLMEYIFFEVELLSRLGFGLDFSRCAATGSAENLMYVSPRSGRAVSEEAGQPYREKLLSLPKLLRHGIHWQERVASATHSDMVDALNLTRYFLEKHIFAHGNLRLPRAREHFAQTLERGTLERGTS